LFCNTRNISQSIECEKHMKSLDSCQNWTNSPHLTCLELNYFLLGLLLKLVYIRLICVSWLRAHKGTREHSSIRLFLFWFCSLSAFYPILLILFEPIFNAHMFRNIDPMIIFIVFNFMIGLTF
jgi:hypothetical protein